MGETISRERREEYLRQAQKAAAEGDLKGMNTALFKSLVPDGVVANLKRKWPYLADDDVEYLVAEAIDILYQYVRDGKTVSRIAGFLVKVTHRRAYKLYESRPDRAVWDSSDIENYERDYSDDLDSHTEREERVTRALATARALLPRLGQQGVREVMEIILDGVERGVTDLPSTEIGEVLDRSPATVRQQRKRGFDRLAREARKEGLRFDTSYMESEEEEELEEDYA